MIKHTVYFWYQSFTVYITIYYAYVIFTFSETVSMSKKQFFYYNYFHYIYKWTKDWKLSNFGEIQCSSIETSSMPKDLMHKIGIIGVFTEVKRQIHIKNRCPITVELFMMENDCKWCLSLFEYTNDIHLFIQEREIHQKITLFGK